MLVRSLSLRTLGVLALSATLAACAGDDEPKDGDTDTDGSTTDTDDVTDSDEDTTTPPVYGVISVPASNDGTSTAYVILKDSLTGTFDPADAVLELEGRPVAATYKDWVFIGSSTAPELTRYKYEGGKLVKEETISFAGQQVTAFAGYSAQLQIIDADTAYWFDRGGRIVVWNPTEFAIERSIVVEDIVREIPGNEGNYYSTSFTGAPLWHGDHLISFVSWDTRAANKIVIPREYGILVVDTKNDTAQFHVDVGGCGYGRDGVIDGDWLYVHTEAVGSAVWHLDEANGQEPCLRRFNLKTGEFDDWSWAFSEEAGGPVGSLAVAADGTPLLHVLDVEAADPLIDDGTISNPRVLSSADLWQTARLTVGDEPSLEILDQPLRSASVLPVTLKGGLRVTPTFGDDPQLVEVTADGFVATDRVNAKLTGFTSAVFQIR